jgi:hypothetical protein
MKWHERLPDVDAWQPTSVKQNILSNALMITCRTAQIRIMARVKAELEFNLHNFDSGLDVEAIIRDELSNLLPSRYVVTKGILSDRSGSTAGECDLLVRDHLWSSVIKLGATAESRRYHFPIEGVYAAAEVKQTLGFKQLDEAMEKLVVISRLERPDNPYGHITENQHLPFLDKPGFVLNPLHTTVFATGLANNTTFEDMAFRFGEINSQLQRDHMVKMLCVLGHGTAWYSVETGIPYNATYMSDRQQNLILQVNSREPTNVFYRFYVELSSHLTRSVLGFGDLSNAYGQPPPNRQVKSYQAAAFNDSSVSAATGGVPSRDVEAGT